MKFTFTCIADDSINTKITTEITTDYLPDIQPAFTEFLRGCGFIVDYDLGSRTLREMLEAKLAEEGKDVQVKLVERKKK